jgi:hypothetical protein
MARGGGRKRRSLAQNRQQQHTPRAKSPSLIAPPCLAVADTSRTWTSLIAPSLIGAATDEASWAQSFLPPTTPIYPPHAPRPSRANAAPPAAPAPCTASGHPPRAQSRAHGVEGAVEGLEVLRGRVPEEAHPHDGVCRARRGLAAAKSPAQGSGSGRSERRPRRGAERGCGRGTTGLDRATTGQPAATSRPKAWNPWGVEGGATAFRERALVGGWNEAEPSHAQANMLEQA